MLAYLSANYKTFWKLFCLDIFFALQGLKLLYHVPPK